MSLLNKYGVKIYRDDIFIGFVRKYRKHRNGFYRFEKTNDLNKALIFNDNISPVHCEYTLTNNIDKFYYFNKNYYFRVEKINNQDIRFSKLSILRFSKFGIFKNK